jgi:hypothetical protein
MCHPIPASITGIVSPLHHAAGTSHAMPENWFKK